MISISYSLSHEINKQYISFFFPLLVVLKSRRKAQEAIPAPSKEQFVNKASAWKAKEKHVIIKHDANN